jgi:hypothetical protein
MGIYLPHLLEQVSPGQQLEDEIGGVAVPNSGMGSIWASICMSLRGHFAHLLEQVSPGQQLQDEIGGVAVPIFGMSSI